MGSWRHLEGFMTSMNLRSRGPRTKTNQGVAFWGLPKLRFSGFLYFSERSYIYKSTSAFTSQGLASEQALSLPHPTQPSSQTQQQETLLAG